MRPGFLRVAICIVGVTVTVSGIGSAVPVAVAATKPKVDAATKPKVAKPATKTTEPAAKTFCEGWAKVRAVRSTGLTGIAVLRLQAERYRALVELAPKDLRPQVKVMADYFTTTLAMADQPLNNAKQSAALEALIPKIGDALTAVTRHAVRTCPRSVVLPTTTSSPDVASSTAAPTTREKKKR